MTDHDARREAEIREHAADPDNDGWDSGDVFFLLRLLDDSRNPRLRAAPDASYRAGWLAAAARLHQADLGTESEWATCADFLIENQPPPSEQQPAAPDASDRDAAAGLLTDFYTGPVDGRAIRLRDAIEATRAEVRRAAVEIGPEALNLEHDEALLRTLPEYIADTEAEAAKADDECRSSDNIWQDGLGRILRHYQAIMERALGCALAPTAKEPQG